VSWRLVSLLWRARVSFVQLPVVGNVFDQWSAVRAPGSPVVTKQQDQIRTGRRVLPEVTVSSLFHTDVDELRTAQPLQDFPLLGRKVFWTQLSETAATREKNRGQFNRRVPLGHVDGNPLNAKSKSVGTKPLNDHVKVEIRSDQHQVGDLELFLWIDPRCLGLDEQLTQSAGGNIGPTAMGDDGDLLTPGCG